MSSTPDASGVHAELVYALQAASRLDPEDWDQPRKEVATFNAARDALRDLAAVLVDLEYLEESSPSPDASLLGRWREESMEVTTRARELRMGDLDWNRHIWRAACTREAELFALLTRRYEALADQFPDDGGPGGPSVPGPVSGSIGPFTGAQGPFTGAQGPFTGAQGPFPGARSPRPSSPSPDTGAFRAFGGAL